MPLLWTGDDMPSAGDPIEPLDQQIERLQANLDRWAERHRRIAATLRTFALSAISASSLQPILDLARELNPDLGVKIVATDPSLIDVHDDSTHPF